MSAPSPHKVLNHRFELTVAAGDMRATISPVPEPSVIESERETLLRELQSHQVTKGILDTFRVEDDVLVVAEGVPAVDGKDGWIECLFDTHHTLHITEDHGHVDYKNLGLVANAVAGKPVAKRHLPTQGTNGFTVFGKALPAKHGKLVEFVPGENVEAAPDGYHLLAKIDGHPEIVGNKVSIYSGYTVEGDVDYSSGNIDFLGSVTVNGAVMPGFSVKAAGNVIISGGIEEAVVESGGNVTIQGGVLGRGECHIKAAGDLLCMFAEHATLEAGGDIRAKNYLKSCHVSSEGSVFLEEGRGTIFGGQITARKMIRAHVIGTELGETTVLTILGKVEFLRKKEQLKKTIKETEAQLDQFYASVDRFVQAFPDPEERAAKMSEVENFLSSKYENADRELKEVEEILNHKDDSCIQATERLFANTEITIALATTMVQKEHGPSHVALSEGRILTLPLSAEDLTKTAK